MGKYQGVKCLVREYYEAMEKAAPEEILAVLREYTSPNFEWKGSHPFRDLSGIEEVASEFWTPLKKSLDCMQRREDIFIAGNNRVHPQEVWVMSMGNFMGNFEEDWLGIRRTRKMNNLRYAEFSCVENGKISKTGLFVDILGFMNQAGINPLPPQTGAFYLYPGPRDHNGLLLEDAPEEESEKTLAAIRKMGEELVPFNESMDVPSHAYLESAWDEDMIWYGPCGDGCSYTTKRYVEQHVVPFRTGLEGKTFNGHEVQFAEGKFACYFGWPNLTNTAIGGFLGFPGGRIAADMQVVDVYYRRNEKLSENWVIIDFPYWLKMQGLDILERTREILNP